MSASSAGSVGEPLTPGGSYPKAPGSERSERSSSREEDHQVNNLVFWLLIRLIHPCRLGQVNALHVKIRIIYIRLFYKHYLDEYKEGEKEII